MYLCLSGVPWDKRIHVEPQNLRADKAKIVYTETGEVQEILSGITANALQYELQNMEESVRTGINKMKLDYTVDVMDIMTKLRKEWGMTYPEEEM